jgi:hypothetical protein
VCLCVSVQAWMSGVKAEGWTLGAHRGYLGGEEMKGSLEGGGDLLPLNTSLMILLVKLTMS